jgi:hypothetical protein
VVNIIGPIAILNTSMGRLNQKYIVTGLKENRLLLNGS